MQALTSNPNQRHDIDIVIDRVIIKADIESRVAQFSGYRALYRRWQPYCTHRLYSLKTHRRQIVIGKLRMLAYKKVMMNYSVQRTLAIQCQRSYEVPEPRHFSFNSPLRDV